MASPALGQSTAAPSQSACFIELQKLMADTSGIADLRTAMRDLDAKLRPQVEEVRRLKHLVEALEREQEQAVVAAAAVNEAEGAVSLRPVALPVAVVASSADAGELGRATLDLRHANEELEARRAQLKADYAAQMQAIVGPVQERVGQQAQAFGTQRGCTNVKVARNNDLGPLRSAGAQDVTRAFVSWYGQNRR